VEPFVSPLVADDSISSGGFVSYVPLPFAKSIKITTNGTGQHFFYNIGYHTYGPDAQVESWTGKEDASAVIALWNDVAAGWARSETAEKLSGSLDLAAESSVTVAELEGPSVITSLHLQIPGVRRDADARELLNSVRMKMYWDGEQEASVDAPLGSLFAMGQFGAYGTKALPVGLDDHDRMYMYFPMPFEKQGRIVLENEGEWSVEQVQYEIGMEPLKDSFDDIAYFKTRFTRQSAERFDGQDLTVLDVEGSGHFVGVVQSLRSELNQGIADRWHLEGDERIYVDDSQSPAIHGTGTEDFYNGGWYFSRGLYTQPQSGYTAFQIEDNIDSTAMYRFFLQDAVPFRRSIKVFLEHGADNDVTEDVWLLAYYYHQPRQRMVLTDTLDVGNPESEQQHAYAIDQEVTSGIRAHTYEGVSENEVIRDDGRFHAGSSRFEMDILPDNAGVILRRRYEQWMVKQEALVYVDDELVGKWYRVGSNGFHSWRDDDVLIPPAFTKGKSRIRVNIQHVENAPEWNEFRYQAYSLVE
jgi:hypothetical protein